MTGDDAWNMQSALPDGATLLGIMLSSDKTTISAVTGDRVAHPLIISLANISMNTRAKISSDSFLLTALLPVPKFIHKKKRMRGVLEDRLVHQCLDIILEPLKRAACVGVMMSDPSTTLAQLKVVYTRADPLDLEAFFHEVQKFRLNGVAEPFWHDWILAEPSHFFTPELLHHIHWEFWDHNAKWLINALGESEIDFRFSVLPRITGFQHFHGVCADAAPQGVLTARISAALTEFHAHKDTIITAGLRRGEGKKVITNWHIPNSNSCRALSRASAILVSPCNGLWMQQNMLISLSLKFQLGQATVIIMTRKSAVILILRSTTVVEFDEGYAGDEGDEGDSDEDIPADLLSTVTFPGCSRPIMNYFMVANTFHLAYSPSIRSIAVDEAAVKFGLPDLRPAIADFFHRHGIHGQHYVHPVGVGRRAGPDVQLPFDNLQVWFKLRLQDTDFHDSSTIQPAQMLNCTPPCDAWPWGRFDTVLINTCAGFSWPASGFQGYSVVQIRLIMRLLTGNALQDCFLTYVHRFDSVTLLGSDGRDLTTQLHVFKRAKRSNGTRLGDVILLSQVKSPINLIPRFGSIADNRLTTSNCMEHCSEFWLNKYWNKQSFFSLST
ncbi:uncharacterized protein F5891DRAFT_1186802 [Suillus fuscotomentosus]|uniref:DUF6830 domain-containing protein n=1 Tax=Suillus fuscotomentosus TaxID=1912939 RepID=A0AAD4EA73_9AGAM|nr:uncharacterized protein F5891DRAFT_1186802 [Suillus fuscotomentosus]KAG1902222.1 hypothetical protein F5891DRAFT_1186802 [Suillus fuscotomentosus]